MGLKAPTFLKIDDYKDILFVLARTKEKIGEAKSLLEKIGAVKAEEDAMLAQWNNNIDEVDERLAQMNAILREHGNE